ncbi:MORN repeat-containing protein [Candidatus Venteria ishoeyi]|nr:hypothetical protein [Candidatus Venteria ishoeyi]MDM8546005.1 hypothetical protein [Candidatus Venteria ishoeyi]
MKKIIFLFTLLGSSCIYTVVAADVLFLASNNACTQQEPEYKEKTYKRRASFKGYYVCGKRNGKGVYIYPDQSSYDGSWKDGKKNGYGVYYWPSGNVYRGEWKDNQQHGKGTLTFADGGEFEGYWKYGKVVTNESEQSFIARLQYFIDQGVAILDSSEFKRNFITLYRNPKNNQALCYFGLCNMPGAADELARIKTVLSKNHRINVEDFIQSSTFKQDLIDIVNLVGAPESDYKMTEFEEEYNNLMNETRSKVETYIDEYLDGSTLLQLIDNEKDIKFIPSSENSISICYNGKENILLFSFCQGGDVFIFNKDKELLVKLIETIMAIKPSSKYITKAHPLYSSYPNLLKIYKKKAMTM